MGKTKTAFVGEELNEEKKVRKAKKQRAKKVHISGLKGGQRIKIVEAEATVTEEALAKAQGKIPRGKKERGKKYLEARQKVTPGRAYSVLEAIKLVKETSYSKFDAKVEMHIDCKKTGLSTEVNPPYPSGNEKRVEVASNQTLEKLKQGKIDFDVLLASPEMMPSLLPFAKTLGPKGLMPNPKAGTISKNPSSLIAKFQSGRSLILKTEKQAPIIHTVVGRVSQDEKELSQNVEAILKALTLNQQILKAYLKATMGPSIKLQIG